MEVTRQKKGLSLEGKYVKLKPLSTEEDCLELYEQQTDGTAPYISTWSPYSSEIWKFMPYGPFQTIEAFQIYLKNLETSPDNISFCVMDKQSNQKIGIVNYMNIVPEHKRVEIGGIWYTPSFQRTYANTEATYLLGKYCFEVLQYNRFEWKCGNHVRSDVIKVRQTTKTKNLEPLR